MLVRVGEPQIPVTFWGKNKSRQITMVLVPYEKRKMIFGEWDYR